MSHADWWNLLKGQRFYATLYVTFKGAWYDILITTDANLQYQQNLKDRPFAVLVLRAKSNRLPDLVELVPELLKLIDRVRPGKIQEIFAD